MTNNQEPIKEEPKVKQLADQVTKQAKVLLQMLPAKRDQLALKLEVRVVSKSTNMGSLSLSLASLKLLKSARTKL